MASSQQSIAIMTQERFHTEANMARLIKDLYPALLTNGFYILKVEYDQDHYITYIKLGSND